MNPNLLWIVKICLGGIGGIFVVLGAFFGYWDIHKEDNQENIKAWFRKKWEVINKSKWLLLPEKVIKWFLDFPAFLVRMGSLPFINDDRTGCFFFISGPTLLAIGCWLYWNSFWVAILVMALFLFLSFLFWVTKRSYEVAAVWFYRKVIISILIASTTIWTIILLNLNISSAAPLMLVISPFYWFALGMPLGLFLEKLRGGPSQPFVAITLLFFIGISLGFTLTFLALLIGHIAAPESYIPQTLQVLISNILFDGLTMIITFAILEWTISQKIMLRVPMAILLDLIAAAILACGSLFCGLVFTKNALNLGEILNVLIARSPDGSSIQFSPYFWVMHTTFIPTLLYLLFILFCWFAKAFLIPVRLFFGKGQEHKNPLRLTAGLFGLLSAIAGVLFWVAGEVYEQAKDHNPIQSQAIKQEVIIPKAIL